MARVVLRALVWTLVVAACGQARSRENQGPPAPSEGGGSSTRPNPGSYGRTVGAGGSTLSIGVAGSGLNPNCRSIGVTCIDGTICEPLVCGIADSGVRSCWCTTPDWECTPCDFSNGSFRDPPDVIEACPAEAMDEVPCTDELTVCGPVESGEYCACWPSPSDGLSWDCDDAPPQWGL